MKTITLIIIFCLAFFLAGCSNATSLSHGKPEKGAVWLVPGIEGQTFLTGDVEKALRANNYEGDINRYNWGNPLMPLKNLRNAKHKQLQSQRLADELSEYSRQYPGQPIDMIGYSGGAGLAVLALEKLPHDVRVRNVTLVHGALSPEYDLTEALAKIDGRLKNVYSSADWLILGIGTRIFGTVDGTKTDSAGMIGFDLEKSVPDRSLRCKLEQIPWRWDQHRWGGHLTLYDYKFNRDYVTTF